MINRRIDPFLITADQLVVSAEVSTLRSLDQDAFVAFRRHVAAGGALMVIASNMILTSSQARIPRRSACSPVKSANDIKAERLGDSGMDLSVCLAISRYR